MSRFACSLTGMAVAAGFALSTPAFSQSTTKPEPVAQTPAAAPPIDKQHVDGGDCCAANTFFTQLPGVEPKPDQQSAPAKR